MVGILNQNSQICSETRPDIFGQFFDIPTIVMQGAFHLNNKRKSGFPTSKPSRLHQSLRI